MKIAFCSPISLTNFSGAAKFLITAAKLMASNGHEVTIYALPFGPNRIVSASKIQNFLSPVPYYETRNIEPNADIAYINYAPFIWRKMKIKGIRLAGLHTHLVLPNQHIKETLTHPFNAGFEWYAKAVGFAFLLPLVKTDLMSFDAVHIPSGDFSLYGKNRLYKIPLWIDMSKIPRRKSAKFERFTILFTGRKTWEKGWFMFCEVSSRLKQMGYDFRFLCTGKGHDHIRGLGFLSEDELFDIYQRSHVVLYPSIADVFGLVILEAAACGVPVVTTPITVHKDQRLPVLYARDISEFVKALLHVHSIWKEQIDRYQTWCDSLRKHAEKYDVDRIFPIFEKMLEDTAEKEGTKIYPNMSVGWVEPRVAFCHKSEKTSRIQRLKELKWASQSSGRTLRGLTLDIGGGKGYVARLLDELGCQAIGLDIKPSFVQHMVRMGLPSVLADARKLPFRS
jgi:glycosyltransferase involved in cell wall biosynthesis